MPLSERYLGKVKRATARVSLDGLDARVDKRTRIAELAVAQHGVITSRQALELGLSRSAISRLIRSGAWITLFPGTHRLCESPPTWEQTVAAACLWGGDGSVASHRAAVRLHGLGFETAIPELYIPRPSGSHRRDYSSTTRACCLRRTSPV